MWLDIYVCNSVKICYSVKSYIMIIIFYIFNIFIYYDFWELEGKF